MSRYLMDKVMRQIVLDDSACRAYREDPALFLRDYELLDEERDALIKMDYPKLYAMGAHPFLLVQFTRRVWPADRATLDRGYGAALAPHGYPDFAT